MLLKSIFCPNCGGNAERNDFWQGYLTKTQCFSCDYLAIVCPQTGKVIEAYAPGIDARSIRRHSQNKIACNRVFTFPCP